MFITKPLTLHIAPTASTPQVWMDPEQGEFKLKGRSMPEDPSIFYGPLVRWLEAYAQRPATSTRLSFAIDFFDTATCPYLLRLMKVIRHLPKAQVDWHYEPEDTTTLEAGELFAVVAKVPFYFVPGSGQ